MSPPALFSSHFPILAILKSKSAAALNEVTDAIDQVLSKEQIVEVNFNIKSQSQGDIYYLNILLKIKSEEELATLYQVLNHCPSIAQLL